MAPGATVYFDARNAPPGARGPGRECGVNVVYCKRREADEAILDAVREADDARHMLVVTNDRKVGGIAGQHGARRLGVREFFGPPGEAEAQELDRSRVIRGRWRFKPSDFGLPDDVDLENPPDLDD